MSTVYCDKVFFSHVYSIMTL